MDDVVLFDSLINNIKISLGQFASSCAVAQIRNPSKSKTRVLSQEMVDCSLQVRVYLEVCFCFVGFFFFCKWRKIGLGNHEYKQTKWFSAIGWLGSALEIWWRAQRRAATPTCWKKCFWYLVRMPPGCLVVFFGHVPVGGGCYSCDLDKWLEDDDKNDRIKTLTGTLKLQIYVTHND